MSLPCIYVEGVHRLDTSLKLDFWQVLRGDLVVFNHITGVFYYNYDLGYEILNFAEMSLCFTVLGR